MAKTLDSYERTDGIIPAGRPQIYPWDDWFDGRIWMLTQGEDYHISTEGMIGYVRKMALARDFETSVYLHDEDAIVIKPKD